jgi:hypothetical protein
MTGTVTAAVTQSSEDNPIAERRTPILPGNTVFIPQY